MGASPYLVFRAYAARAHKRGDTLTGFSPLANHPFSPCDYSAVARGGGCEGRKARPPRADGRGVQVSAVVPVMVRGSMRAYQRAREGGCWRSRAGAVKQAAVGALGWKPFSMP